MAPRAAEASRLTARELHKLGVADEVVPEPTGGAHLDMVTTMATLKEALIRNLDALIGVERSELVNARYLRFRSFGTFVEGE